MDRRARVRTDEADEKDLCISWQETTALQHTLAKISICRDRMKGRRYVQLSGSRKIMPALTRSECGRTLYFRIGNFLNVMGREG